MTVSRRLFLRGAVLAPVALAAPAVLRFGDVAQAEAISAVKAPQFQRRMVGEIEVIALLDGLVQFPTATLTGYDEAKAAAAAKLGHKPHDPKAMTLGVNGYLIRTGDRLIAVDTGASTVMGPTVGAWHAALAAAGYRTDQVDTVFLTHLHPDHVGGMADPATGAALLPKAQLIASEADWAFTHDAGVYASLPAAVQGFFDVSRAMVAPYDSAKSLIRPGAEIAPGLTTVALQGHTPGHMGLRVDSGRESLLLWGDVIISSTYQFANPDWAFAFDADPTMAVTTRNRALDMVASDGMMVAGTHLDFPGFGYVERAKQGYGFVAAPWDYRI